LKLVEICFFLQVLFCYGFNLNFTTFNQKVCKIILLNQHCCFCNYSSYDISDTYIIRCL